MSLRKFARKVIPYNIRFLLNPLVKHLLHKSFRQRALYTKLWESVPVNNQMIFYEAYHGRSISGNPLAVFTHLLEESAFQHYTHIWAVREDTVIPDQFQKLPNVLFVTYQSDEYVKYLAIAKYLFNDTSFPIFFQKRKEQVYVNTWHGTPIKTLGMDIKNRGVTDHSNIQRNFLFADYLISPNQYTAKKLLKSYDIDSIFGGKILDIGYPRVDLMFRANKEQIRQKLGIPEDKEVILYAPTWRGKLGSEENQSEKLFHDIQKLKQQISNDYVVLLKSHYFAAKHFEEQGVTNICVPNWIDTNELLSVVDILITDYSSIFFEYLPTKKPIIFYADDVEEYEEERGLYIPMQKLPGPLCQTIDEVTYYINQLPDYDSVFHDVYEEFLKTYCYHDDGQATKRLVDTVIHGKETAHAFNIETNKTKILMYGGGFLNNGITSAITSLLNSIDYEKYDVTLVDHGSNKSKIKWGNMKKVNHHVHRIFRVGTWNASLQDLYRHTLYLFTGNKRFAPVEMYKREYDRMVGLSQFDVGIDFGGYSPFWAAIFAFGKFKRKSIYLHSDMKKELDKVVNNKYPHRKNLRVIFSLYNEFDKVLSVSELTHQQNWTNLKHFVDQDVKMDYVTNPVDYKHIFQLRKMPDFQYEFGEELHPTTTVRPPISDEDFPYPEEHHTNFITIGRLSPEKDHKKLIEAFSQVVALHPNVRLYIVGDGALKNELTHRIHSLNLQEKIIITGHLQNPYSLLDRCDCFVLSSNYEGQAIVLLEALILGKPVITTDIPGPRSVVEGGYGLIVENSVSGLVSGMVDYIHQGKFTHHPFDYESYHTNAMNMFYDKVCKLD